MKPLPIEQKPTACFAIVPAAGRGSRLGGELPKQYASLLGKTVLEHTITALTQAIWINKIMVVLAPDDVYGETLVEQLSSQINCPVDARRIGGNTRAESVRNGLTALQNQVSAESWVLVHDAARPCLSTLELECLRHQLLQNQDPVGGLLAIPLADTLKRANTQQRVVATEPRTMLWQAQTPQLFRYGILQQAFSALSDEALAQITDEAQAIELLGYSPKLVRGSIWNRKITFAEDLLFAEQFLDKHSPC